jgi:hypothetical protein
MNPDPMPSRWKRLWLQEDLNFLLTNRVPRIALTRLMGWYSGLHSPGLTRLSIAVWRLFTDLDLSESPPARYAEARAAAGGPAARGPGQPVRRDRRRLRAGG